ncbi:CDP-alcohol phosphatidyltransferase family protein [Galactobacter sp.]|uniref:CDP-alcohol phosphatidyltransferase family protein n=1 Tax=Galactobacter sp. TaxID=2676125 RepID=UPI0025BBD594|nr:CDP-alcohol phosphatidyltransferase family protein [Galactobacter sp.]
MRLIGAGQRDDIDYVELHTFWTVPNLITLVRFALIPVFTWLVATGHPVRAFFTLAVVFSTDWVDGYVARRFNQVSSVGKWLAPFADRLTLIIVATTFVVFNVAPPWFVWAIVIPDVGLALACIVLFRGSPELPVTKLGKIRTAVLMISAPLLLLSQADFSFAEPLETMCTWVLLLGSLLHVAAACQYLAQAVAKAKSRKGRRPSRTKGHPA